MTDTQHRAEADVAAALGRLSTNVEPYSLDGDTSLVLARVRADEALKIVDLETKLIEPLAARGNVTVYDPDSFCRLTDRLGISNQTTVWADVEQASVTSILNDHSDVAANRPGWRDHRLSLKLRYDADWLAWTKHDGKLLDQATFAEHIEDLVHTVTRPSAAEMLEVSRTFQAKRNVSFSSATRLDSGDVQFDYTTETTAKAGKGNVEVPTEFELVLPVYVNTDPVVVRARLRYRVHDGGGLGIGYALLRPDLVKQSAFTMVFNGIKNGTAATEFFEGTAPAALRDQR